MSKLGCFLLVLAVNLTIGGVCFDYALFSMFGKDIPWYADALCGLVLAEIVGPVALVCWIVRLCGVHAPFFS